MKESCLDFRAPSRGFLFGVLILGKIPVSARNIGYGI